MTPIKKENLLWIKKFTNQLSQSGYGFETNYDDSNIIIKIFSDGHKYKGSLGIRKSSLSDKNLSSYIFDVHNHSHHVMENVKNNFNRGDVSVKNNSNYIKNSKFKETLYDKNGEIIGIFSLERGIDKILRHQLAVTIPLSEGSSATTAPTFVFKSNKDAENDATGSNDDIKDTILDEAENVLTSMMDNVSLTRASRDIEHSNEKETVSPNNII